MDASAVPSYIALRRYKDKRINTRPGPLPYIGRSGMIRLSYAVSFRSHIVSSLDRPGKQLETVINRFPTGNTQYPLDPQAAA